MVCLILALALTLPVLTSASALTGLNSFATARFSTGHACYSGPGYDYFRANSGKAMYGGGGVARVYGVTGNWIMIGYELGSGDYRIGYIEKTALKEMYDVKGTINYDLSFSGTTAWAARACELTDDPVIHNKPIYTIPQGTVVTALGTMGTDWTYVEVLGSSSYMRGFVRSGSITFAPPAYSGSVSPSVPQVPTTVPNTFYHNYNKGNYLPSYQTVRFSGSWPVYSGPGVNYFRANEGRATMGGGACRLYGVENGWALIGYELNNGGYRIGYVETSALPQQGLRIPYLDLINTARTLIASAALTDDIVMYKPTLRTLPAGTQVTFLGLSYGLSTTWAYVEAMGASSLMRGFIPASALGM